MLQHALGREGARVVPPVVRVGRADHILGRQPPLGRLVPQRRHPCPRARAPRRHRLRLRQRGYRRPAPARGWPAGLLLLRRLRLVDQCDVVHVSQRQAELLSDRLDHLERDELLLQLVQLAQRDVDHLIDGGDVVWGLLAGDHRADGLYRLSAPLEGGCVLRITLPFGPCRLSPMFTSSQRQRSPHRSICLESSSTPRRLHRASCCSGCRRRHGCRANDRGSQSQGW